MGWLALAAGAAAGTWAFSAYGLNALSAPAGTLLVLALATGGMTLRERTDFAAEKGGDEPA
jgi:predicted MFS family arabinose efflux permease